MYKIFIILLVAIKKIFNDIPGCLQLTPNSLTTCGVCDTMMNYSVVQGTCVISQIQNCMISFQSGWCMLCNYGYFLDGSFECTKTLVNTFVEISNCNNYLSVNQCLVCNLNTYLVNGVCRPMSVPMISGCTINEDSTKCSTCNLMLISKDGQKCNSVPATGFKNCLFFRNPVVCTQCKPGFIPNPNYMIMNINSTKMYTAFFFQLKFWKDSYFSIMLNTPLCTLNYTIANCAVLASNQTCVKCNGGYTLNPSRTKCFIAPRPPSNPTFRILNCYKFASEDYETCQICYEGYMLNSINTGCTKISPLIPNCLIHSQTVKSTCVYCDKNYYLNITAASTIKACVQRINYPTNCGTYDRATDICTSCLNGTIFNFNNNVCSVLIQNCQIYDPSGRVLKCVLCISGYYLDTLNVNCINANGATQGCLTYTYGGTCQVCQQGYYLDVITSKCFPQDSFFGCKTLSITTRNVCDNCLGQAVNTAVVNACKQLSTLNLALNCLQYDSNSNCILCTTGFFLYQGPGLPPSCIQLTGCVSLASVNNNKICGQCSGFPYFLWSGSCLKSDTKNCVYNFQSNSTSAGYQMTTGYPCQVCNRGYYYIVNPGVRTQVCNAITLGSNCLTYYAPTESLTSAYCSRCYRGYTFSQVAVAVNQTCFRDHIIASKNTTAFGTFAVSTSGPADFFRSYYMGSYSWDLLVNVYWYNMVPAYLPTMFPWQTFTGVSFPLIGPNSAQFASPTTYCYQFSADLRYCLSCKFYYPPVYVASSWSAFLASTNLIAHSRWVYQYLSASKDFDELTYLTASPAVSGCRSNQTDNLITSVSMVTNPSATHPLSGPVGQSMSTFYIGVDTYNLCLYGHDFSQWTMDHVLLTAFINITSVSTQQSNWPIGWGAFLNQAYWLGSTVPPNYQSMFNATCTKVGSGNETAIPAPISNCALLQNNTNLMTTFEQRVYLSCAQCLTGFNLTATWYNATIMYSKTNGVFGASNKFVWITNECVNIATTTNFLSFMKVENCYYYNRSSPGGRIYYTCQACQIGSIPATTLQAFQCSVNDRWADPTQQNNCLTAAPCTNYLICQHLCGGLCTGPVCNQTTGTCNTNVCNQCPNSAIEQCQNSPTTCLNDWFCNFGTCQPICTCFNGETCTSKSNYVCTPLMSGSFAALNLVERIIDIIIANSIALGNSTNPTNYCGCTAGNICEGGVCYKLSQCPVCSWNNYCLATLTVVNQINVYTYSCVYHPACQVCSGTQYCQSTFDYITGVSAIASPVCGNSPQFTFPYTMASCPSCKSCWNCMPDELCVNGTCIRQLQNVCGFAFTNTVPIYCNSTTTCYLGKCVNFTIIANNYVYDCGCLTGQICVNLVCYTLTQCPICPKNSFCSPAKQASGEYIYSCVVSNFCVNQCFGTNYCHSAFNFTTNVRTFDMCRPYPQLTFPDPYVECTAPSCAKCTANPCNTDQQCVSGVCIPNAYKACNFFIKNTVPLYCTSLQSCVNSDCIASTSLVNSGQYITTSCGAGKIYINDVCYSLAHCPICSRNQYCLGTFAAGVSTFECGAQSLFVCTDTSFAQASYNFQTGASVVTGCGPSPQFSFPYTAVTCASCTLCSPVCSSLSTCVNGVCIPNLIGVCYFVNNAYPIYCNPREVCVNSVCMETLSLGSSFIINCKAVTNSSICVNNQTVAIAHCPVCPPNQYCKGTLNTGGSYSFTCQTSAVCATCLGFNKWCAATFNFLTGVSAPVATCQTYPQFGFPYTDVTCPTCVLCSPVCSTSATCVNGVCVPNLLNVCGWAFDKTVPVICENYEICINGVCYKGRNYAMAITTTCPVGKLLYKGTCYTLNQCPLCGPGFFCKQTYTSGSVYLYTCTASLVVCNCPATYYCWGSYDFFPSSTSSTSSAIGCFPFPQFQMLPSNVIPPWTACTSPVCTATQSCVNGTCIPNPTLVCYFTTSGIAMSCNVNQTCFNSICLESVILNTVTVADAGCGVGQVFLSGACHSLTACPVCQHNEYCQGSLAPTTRLLSQNNVDQNFKRKNNFSFYDIYRFLQGNSGGDSGGGTPTPAPVSKASVFKCASHTSCFACQGLTTFCQGTYDYQGASDIATPACANSLIWDYTNTLSTCSPACTAPAICVGSVCIPASPTGTCAFFFYNTVPFTCAGTEFCIDKLCFLSDITLGCRKANKGSQICIPNSTPDGDIYTLTQCPVCPRNYYCQGSVTATVFSYKCVYNAACDACTGTNFCQGTFDYATTGTVETGLKICGPSPQWTFDPTGTTVNLGKCTGPVKSDNPITVGDTFICADGTSLPILTNICNFGYNGVIPTQCNNTQICVNSQCVDNFAVYGLARPLVRFFVPPNTVANELTTCPICPYNSYCKPTYESATNTYTFACFVDSGCSTCTINQFCRGSYDFTLKAATIATTACSSTPQLTYSRPDCASCNLCSPSCLATQMCINGVCVTAPYGCSPPCAGTSYCKATYNSGPKTFTFACVVDPICSTCVDGTSYCQGEINFATGASSIMQVATCSVSQQIYLGTGNCDNYGICSACSPACAVGSICINAVCTTSPAGCTPACGNGEICKATVDTLNGGYSYACAAEAACSVCTGTEFCQGSINYSTAVTSIVMKAVCASSQQTSLGTGNCHNYGICSACTVACAAGSICINGVCTTSPAGCISACGNGEICKATVDTVNGGYTYACAAEALCSTCTGAQYCQGSINYSSAVTSVLMEAVCASSQQSSLGTGNCDNYGICSACTVACAAGSICINGVCTTSPAGCSPTCGKDEFCQATVDTVNGGYTYACVSDPNCNCPSNKFCYGTINYLTGVSEVASSACKNTAQVNLVTGNCDTFAACDKCKGANTGESLCTTDQICINAVCVNTVSSVYGCSPACTNDKYCQAVYSATPSPSYTFSCVSDTLCSTCTGTKYCQGSLDIITGVTTIVQKALCALAGQTTLVTGNCDTFAACDKCKGANTGESLCTTDQICINAVCVNTVSSVYGCSPACTNDKYCQAVYSATPSPSYTFTCVSDTLCSTCTGTKYCQGSLDIITGVTTIVQTVSCALAGQTTLVTGNCDTFAACDKCKAGTAGISLCSAGQMCLNAICINSPYGCSTPCTGTQYCKATVSGSTAYTFTCTTDSICNTCTTGSFCQGAIDTLSGASSIVQVAVCATAPQQNIGIQNCALCAVCLPACASTKVCVNGVCIDNLPTGFCGWDNLDSAIVCVRNQTCVNQVCRNTYQLGSTMIVDCGCDTNSVCISGQCYQLNQCPVCLPQEYCKGTKNADNTYTFQCVSSTTCNTCGSGTWCQGNFNYVTGVSSVGTCGSSPQFSFSTTCSTCPTCTSCTLPNKCVSGVCIPPITSVVSSTICGFAFFNTVPIICTPTQYCYKGICVNSDVPAAICTANQVQIAGVCYNLKQCPICTQTQYCKATNINGTMTYECVSNDVKCAACAGTNYCQATYGYQNGTSSASVTTCGPSPQFTFPWPFATASAAFPTVCSPACPTTQQCLNGVCMDNLLNLCDTYSPPSSGAATIFCKSTDICVSGTCQNRIQMASQIVASSNCLPGSVFYLGSCITLSNCPICDHNEFCYFNGTSPYTYFCMQNETLCNSCVDTDYCTSTINFGGGAVYPSVKLLTAQCQPFPQFAVPKNAASTGPGNNPANCTTTVAPIFGGLRFMSTITPDPLTCSPNIANVCGYAFRSTVPIICEANQYCVSPFCYDINGRRALGMTDCPIGSLKYNGVCYPLMHCPPCLKTQFCSASYTGGKYVFTCVSSVACQACTGTNFCISTYDWKTTSTTASTGSCSPSPQFTFATTTFCTICAVCTPTCTSGQCVNGICIPNLLNICYFAGNNTIPVTCPSGTTCFKSQCMTTLTLGTVTVTDCGCNAGQICINENCLSSTYTVACPQNQFSFIAATGATCSSVPVCTANTACNACTGKQICQGNFIANGLSSDITTTGSIFCTDRFIASFTMTGTNPTSSGCPDKLKCGSPATACVSPSICFNNTFCLSTLTAPLNPTLVCAYAFRGTVPVVCPVGQTCYSGVCLSAAPIVYNSCGCPVGSICTNGACYALTQCPPCTQNQYCRGSMTGSGASAVYTFTCVASTVCACTDTNYCTATFNFQTGSSSETGNCQPYPQFGFVYTAITCQTCTLCSPACSIAQFCVNGICIPNLTKVCTWELQNTVPIYCGLTETCIAGVCVKTCTPDCLFGFFCSLPSRTCLPLPTFTQNTIISSCTNVQNCGINTNYSRTLNTCSKCAELYAFEVNNSTTINNVLQINYTNTKTCVSVPTNACYNAKITNTDPLNPSGDCFKCQTGYYLDTGFCFPLINNCTFVNSTGYCLGCTYAYLNEYQNVTDGIFQTGNCQKIDATVYSVGTPYSGLYDVNCAYFSLYYPTNVIPPVQLSQGSNYCVQCLSNFFLTSQIICLPMSIVNCTAYNSASTPTNILCAACSIGNTLASNGQSCIFNLPPPFAATPNCNLYYTNQSCAQCIAGSVLGSIGLNIYGQNTYCFTNITSDSFCALTNSTYFFLNSFISCGKCNNINGNQAFPFNLPSFNYMCLNLIQIPNCLYQNATLLKNNMTCLQCINGYYFNPATNACVLRTLANYPIADCIAYANMSDTCAQLFQKSSATITVVAPLPLSTQILINNPPILLNADMIYDFGGWIMGCQVYNDAQTCYQCYPPKYLDTFSFDYNTQCKTVPSVIPYCAVYNSNDLSCTACQLFYMLNNGGCTLITAENCLTFASPNLCATCPQTYPILLNGNCQIDYSNPWCYIYIPTQTPDVFQCDTCLENFYPNDDGICSKVHNPVGNCQYYQFDGLCKTCNVGFYLQYDGKQCLTNPNWDQNCQTFNYGTECSVCDFGYVIVNGTCTKCLTGVECAYCNPNALTTCLFCSFGYYMTSNYSCIINPAGLNGTTYFRTYQWIPASNPIAATGISGQSGLSSEESILRTFILSLVMIFVVFGRK